MVLILVQFTQKIMKQLFQKKKIMLFVFLIYLIYHPELCFSGQVSAYQMYIPYAVHSFFSNHHNYSLTADICSFSQGGLFTFPVSYVFNYTIENRSLHGPVRAYKRKIRQTMRTVSGKDDNGDGYAQRNCPPVIAKLGAHF